MLVVLCCAEVLEPSLRLYKLLIVPKWLLYKLPVVPKWLLGKHIPSRFAHGWHVLLALTRS